MRRIVVKLDERSRTAFECYGLFDSDMPMSDDERSLLESIVDGRLRIAPDDADRIASSVNEISNHLDVLSSEDPIPERAQWYRQDSRALTALYSRILRAMSRRRAHARMEVDRG